MLDRFKPAIYITLAFWGFIAVVWIASPRGEIVTARRSRLPSTYNVFEIHILEGASEVGKSYRIPVIIDHDFDDDQPELTGFVRGLSGLDQVAVGAEQELDGYELAMRPYNNGATISVRGLTPSAKVRARVKYVKSCEVKLSENPETKIVNKSSGMISIPTLKKVMVRSFTTPACREEGDNQTDISAPQAQLSAETIAAQAQAERQAIMNRVNRARAERENQIVRSFRVDALALGPGKTTSLLKENSKPLVKAVCAEFAALLRVLEIQTLTATKREKSKEVKQGYTAVNYSYDIHLALKNGRSYERTETDYYKLPTVFKTIEPDDQECVKIQAPLNSSEDERAQSEALKELRSFLDRYMKSIAYEQAESELLMPVEEPASQNPPGHH